MAGFVTCDPSVRAIYSQANIDLLDTSGNSYIQIFNVSAVLLGTVTFGNPFGTVSGAANEIAGASGLPKSGTGVANGVADNYKHFTGSGILRFSGSVALSGSSPVILDNLNISIAATITVNTCQYVSPV